MITPNSTLSTLSTPPTGHAEWLAKRERTRKLRAELKAARDAGKAIRHAQRLEQIRRRDRMTTTRDLIIGVIDNVAPDITAPAVSADTVPPRRIRCRYLDIKDNRCTAEVVDEVGEILLCVHHLSRALELIRRRAA